MDQVIAPKRRILSFKYALDGILAAFKEEPNLKLHFLFGLLVIALAFVLNLSPLEWTIIIILIGLVISVELTNTAIETVVDAFVDRSHQGAKLAKDISAGAVLITALTAAVSGSIIFLPHLLAFWHG